MTSAPAKEKVILLHRRLGHPSLFLLKTMCPSLFQILSMDEFVFDACQLTELKRITNPLEQDQCQEPFHLIHCDIWGPSPHVDKEGHRWFLICVDDHSHFFLAIPPKTKNRSC